MADYITPEQARDLQKQYDDARKQAEQLNKQYQDAMKGTGTSGNTYPTTGNTTYPTTGNYGYPATTGNAQSYGNNQAQQVVDNSYKAIMDRLQQISAGTGVPLATLQGWLGTTPGYGTWTNNGQLVVRDPNTGKTYISGGVSGGGGNQTPGNGITGGGFITPEITPTEVTPGTEQPEQQPQNGTPLYSAFGIDNRDKINAMYDAQIEAQRAALQEQGDQALSDAQANRDKIAGIYNQQRNAASVDWERQRRNFLEGAMTSGLNTGAGSQAELSMMGMYQRSQNNLQGQQAAAEVEADRNIADIKRNTQAAINEAVAKNDYQRAAALLDEYQNVYKRYAERAEALASYGDFTGYAALYGNEIASQMFYNWAAKNPQVAYMMGAISDQQYNNLMMGYPINAEGVVYSGGGLPSSNYDWAAAQRELAWSMANDPNRSDEEVAAAIEAANRL